MARRAVVRLPGSSEEGREIEKGDEGEGDEGDENDAQLFVLVQNSSVGFLYFLPLGRTSNSRA